MAYDSQRVAEVEALLEGVSLPARREELIDYASRQTEGDRFVRLLAALPEAEFRSLDEVGEALRPTQPAPRANRVALPREESGQPPGGDAYTKSGTEPGAARPDWPEDDPPQKTLEQQTKTQQSQRRRQRGN
jgi:Protein of unknown function (DUF2795)